MDNKEILARSVMMTAAAAILMLAGAVFPLGAQTVMDRELITAMMERHKARDCSSDTVTLRFIGDIMLHKAQLDAARKPDGTFDFSMFLEGIREELEEADIAVANMEFTLAGPPYTGYPSFSAPDSYAEYVAGCGVDIFLTANNHILDKGRKGLERTLSRYRKMEDDTGIMFTGCAENADSMLLNYPLMFHAKGMRLAFINFTYGTNSSFGMKYPGTNLMDMEEISKAIGRAETKDADCIIALPHWGEEYRLRHSPTQEKMARWLAEEGVDIIIGTHPHVVQDCDSILVSRTGGRPDRTVPVIYSLGNAVSNMSADNTQIGLMVTLRIFRDPCGKTVMLPPEYTYLWCSLPGRLKDAHATVMVRDCIGKRHLWMKKYEYDKMMSSYFRIIEETGIEPDETSSR